MIVFQPSAWDQVAAFVLNGLFALLMFVLAWFLRQAVVTLKASYVKLMHLDECMDDVKREAQEDRAAYRLHRQEGEQRDKEISELKREYAGLEGWIKGRAGLAIDTPITQIKAADQKPVDWQETSA